MLKITKVQYIERWDALPPILREAMFSPANGELIWKIGEEHHLKEEQIATIAGICGNIVMGFIHPEDLSKEIKVDVGLDERLAVAIAREIDRKVFSPLRSEIEKVYSPAGPVVEEIIKPEEIIKEVQPPEISRQYGEVEPPKVEITGEHKIDISEFKIIGPEAEPPVPPGMAEKIPEPEIASQEEVQPPEISRQYGEVEPPKVEESPKIEEIKPIIIHEEAEIKAVREQARSFSLGSVFGFFKKKETKTVEPPTTAEIEMEMLEEPTKVVDYEYREDSAKPVQTEPTPPDNLDVQSIEQPPTVQEQPPPENLPIEEIQHKEVGEVEHPIIEEKPEEEKATKDPAKAGPMGQGDDVIDLSNFEKK